MFLKSAWYFYSKKRMQAERKEKQKMKKADDPLCLHFVRRGKLVSLKILGLA